MDTIRRRVWRGRAATFLAGAVPVLAFPEPGWWWLAWVGLVPLLGLVASAPSRREACVRAWFGGAGFMIVMHHWLAPNIGPGLVLFGFLLGLLWLPWGAAVHRAFAFPVSPGRVVGGALVVASVWLLTELVRSWSALGGPWGILGSTQWNHRPALSLAALGGVWAVGFVIVVANVAAAHLVRTRMSGAARAAAAGVLVAALGAGPLAALVMDDPAGDRTATVAVVQPGVGTRAQRLDDSIGLTEGLAGRPLDLVVWGESSVGYAFDDEPAVAARLASASAAVDAALLVNVDARRPGGDGIFKTSVLVDESGARDRYDKMRLVPFGEYIPFRFALGWLSGVSEAADENRRRGDGLAVMDAGGFAVGPLVCFESAFPDMSRNVVARGADVVVVQSATSTFQGSWAPEQHAALAAVRAVETGRPVVHATLTGETAIFDATGRRLATVPTSARDAVVVDVPLTTGTTPFVRWPHTVPVFAGAVAAAGLAFALRAARRTRTAGTPRRSVPSRV